MAYTTRQLIIDAYYLSGIVGRQFQFTSGTEIEDGLDRFNDFLAIKGADSKLIPYYTVTDGNFVAGQEVYYFANLIEIESLTFFLTNPSEPDTNSIRFQMLEQTRQQYFATPRAEHIETLPYIWHMERETGGANLYVYFIPDQAYPYQLVGKYALSQTSLNQDLSSVFDTEYIAYLKYGLAIWLCDWRSVKPADNVVKTYNLMVQKFTTLSRIDFTLRKVSFFNKGGGLTWADVNYGHGWRNN